MIEIGLMFYSKSFEKDIVSAIERFSKRMECGEPNTIYTKDDRREMIAGLKVKFTSLPKNHFVLARELIK